MISIEEMNELTSEQIKSATLELQRLVETQLGTELDLRRLDTIYFPNDFHQSIIDFQVKHNLRERGATNNELGSAHGKTITFEVNHIEKDRIFIHKNILLSLFDDTSSMFPISINLIHHELCHVHDNYLLSSMTRFQDDLQFDSTGLSHVLNLHAMNIFSEYIVPKMAAWTKHTLEIESLSHTIFDSKQIMNTIIEQYEQGELTDIEVFSNVQVIGGQLMKSLATFWGEWSYFQYDQKEELVTLIHSFFKNSYLSNIWLPFKEALLTLDSSYPDWKDVSVLTSFKVIILEMWQCLGVNVNPSALQLTISVKKTID